MYKYLSIKDAAIQFCISEMTIRRAVKKLQKESKDTFEGIQTLRHEKLKNGSKKIFILEKYLDHLYNTTYTNEQVNVQVNDQVNVQVNNQVNKALEDHIESLKEQIKHLYEQIDKKDTLIEDLNLQNKQLKFLSLLPKEPPQKESHETPTEDQEAEIIQKPKMTSFVKNKKSPTEEEKQNDVLDEIKEEHDHKQQIMNKQQEGVKNAFTQNEKSGFADFEKEVRMSNLEWFKKYSKH